MTTNNRTTARVLLNYEEGYKEDSQYVTVEYTPNESVNGCDCTAEDLIELADGEIQEEIK